MRLLGKCPNCGREDTIFQFWKETGKGGDWPKVKCRSCETVWDNLHILITEEKKKGNKLIPMEIRRIEWGDKGCGVELAWPSKRDIPWCNMIVSTLNAALITRFTDPNATPQTSRSSYLNQLDVHLVAEGGVMGRYKGSYIELENIGDHLGLKQDYNQGEGIRRVLRFYQIMLKYLFEVGPESVGGRYRRGEILRLSRENDSERVWQILETMLIYVKSEDFARKVVKKIKGIRRNPIGASYLTGL